MIDTSKYEGHTEGPWHFCLGYDIKSDTYTGINPLKGGGDRVNGPVILSEYQFAKGSTGHRADLVLIEDAPLLLAEVKRLNRFAHCAMNFMSKHDLHFQFLNEHGVYTAPDGGSISVFVPYSYKWDDETKVSSESIQFTVRGEEE